jgi:cation:H+ antiporter
MGIVIPLVLIFFICLFIWRACDGFEIASEYLGRNLSEGVRGGTINAISSSIPELLTTIIGLFVLSDLEGFSVGIGTTAGSALFNGMIIPALCILTVIGTTINGRTVDGIWVNRKVVLRDGLALISCEIVLIWILSGSILDWWQGLLLVALYVLYVCYMVLSMKRRSSNSDVVEDSVSEEPQELSSLGRIFYWLSLGPILDLESFFIREKHKKQIEDESWNPWPLLLASVTVICVSCYVLVFACERLGAASYSLLGLEFSGMGMPVMFVAVIFASMATSVPDTVMSIRDARDGDYDDAISNALGSNIFDICFALGFPLFVYTLIYGHIEMSPDIMDQSGELRFLLLLLTILGFCIFYFGRKKVDEFGVTLVGMGRIKAALLLSIYVVFVAFIISRDKGRWKSVI